MGPIKRKTDACNNDRKDKRILLGMSLREMAERVGVTTLTIFNYEQGKVPVSRAVERVIDIELSKAFINMPIEEIYKNISNNTIVISRLEGLLNKYPDNEDYGYFLRIAIKILKNDAEDIDKFDATAAVNGLILLKDLEKTEKPYIDEAIKYIIDTKHLELLKNKV